jgi:hypothetical protein
MISLVSDCVRMSLLTPLLGNGSVNLFQCKEYTSNNRITVGHGVFSAVHLLFCFSQNLLFNYNVPLLFFTERYEGG